MTNSTRAYCFSYIWIRKYMQFTVISENMGIYTQDLINPCVQTLRKSNFKATNVSTEMFPKLNNANTNKVLRK